MLERLDARWRNLALLGLALLVVWFAWTIRAVLNPLLLGYLCAYVLHPLVVRLERSGLSRRWAVNLIFLLGLALLTLLSFGIWSQGRSLVKDVLDNAELGEKLRAQFEHAREWLGQWVARISPSFHLPTWPEVQQWFKDVLAGFSEGGGGAPANAAGVAWGWLVSFFGSLVGLFGLLLLVPLYSYFLLFELGRIHAFVARYLPSSEKERISRVAGQIGEMLSSFFRGRLLVCLLKGAFLALGMWVFGLPYALLFGLGSGFLGLVPFVGALTGFLGAFLVAVLEPGASGALWKVALVFGAAELLEGYVLLPKILGDSLGLHPIVVLFALMAGGASMGFFGVLIALPLTATIVILVRELVLPALAKSAAGAPAAAPSSSSGSAGPAEGPRER